MFCAAFGVLETGIAERAFPAASVAVTNRGRLIGLKGFGRFVYPDVKLPESLRSGGPAITSATIFDLASVTKAVATTAMAMVLYERGLLELDAPICGILPEFVAAQRDARRSEITFRMLLAHSSGLPAYEKLFLHARTREELLEAALRVPLTSDPDARAEYSDIGFILLGIGLERIAEEAIDSFCQREIFGPIGMTSTTFHPSKDLQQEIPPTADERESVPSRSDKRSTFRKRIVQGEVQDENAFVLGGVAGHAGLFSTGEDVARFAHAMMRGDNPMLRRETVALFTQPATPKGTSRALGWDTPSVPSQAGRYFGAGSFGHLGYTGTSLWIDRERELSITLLTNRTWPNCANQAIKQVRPGFHDAVIEAVINK